jgi:KDO2-lipid IV(A) lauroyltransferase
VDVVEQALGVKPTPDAASLATLLRLRYRLEYLAVALAIGLLRVMPMSWATAITATLWRLAGPRLRQHRRALRNLALAFPEKPAAELEAIARRMWANMGRVAAETVLLDRIVADPSRIVIADDERWGRRMAEAGPAIGVTLHMGNWELAIWPLTKFGRQPAGVYRPLPNPYVDALLRQQRAVLYPGGLLGKGEEDDDGRGGHRTGRLLIDHVRRGGCMGFVCDHNDRRGIIIPFLGSHARFTPVPAMIARHVGARLWVGRCLRLGTDTRFRIDIKEIELIRSRDKTADTRMLTTAIFAEFERWIRENPEQWMWWNTRWVTP